MQESSRSPATAAIAVAQSTALPLLVALSFSHLLNDIIQSLVPAIYPIIKDAYGLDYGQIGLITFAFQLCASLFQPLVGMYTDRRPARTIEPFVVLAGCAARHVRRHPHRPLVQATVSSFDEDRSGWSQDAGEIAKWRRIRGCDPHSADVLEECILGESQLLLYVL